jgi:6,7-dimethyl-8-ribityllumazine synthase
LDLQGAPSAGANRFAVVVSRFNAEVTDGLLAGALSALDAAGVTADARTIVRVPGAFELPVTRSVWPSRAGSTPWCAWAASSRVTPCTSSTWRRRVAGSCHVWRSTPGVPVAFGVLTTRDRRTGPGTAPALATTTKGAEVARAAIEMASLFRALDTEAAS